MKYFDFWFHINPTEYSVDTHQWGEKFSQYPHSFFGPTKGGKLYWFRLGDIQGLGMIKRPVPLHIMDGFIGITGDYQEIDQSEI